MTTIRKSKASLYKIGVFGSDAGTSIVVATLTAKKLGRALAMENVIVITGAAPGLPYIAANEAWKAGSRVWGFSPEINAVRQRKFTPDDDLRMYTKLIYLPKDFEFIKQERVCKKYRNIFSTASCDAGIIISGRWGAMNEFTNLFDMGKVIGVLTGSGGVADEIKRLSMKIKKPGKGLVVYDSSPSRLVRKVVRELNKRSRAK